MVIRRQGKSTDGSLIFFHSNSRGVLAMYILRFGQHLFVSFMEYVPVIIDGKSSSPFPSTNPGNT